MNLNFVIYTVTTDLFFYKFDIFIGILYQFDVFYLYFSSKTNVLLVVSNKNGTLFVWKLILWRLKV